jgi:ribonucleoside-triphosphate reductase
MEIIKPDIETKKYSLTNLGKAVVGFAYELEEDSYKKKMLVRTSRFTIEPFDRNNIAGSLVREAEIPIDLAQRIAREAEKRLLKLDTKHLTAPLIREFVNAILIERGLEEYRHKLTRLGLPVYDVTNLIKITSKKNADVEAIHTSAGNRVLEEYTLLNILPRDVADAHLSGTVNLNNLNSWILKPNNIMHDIRFFLKFGLNYDNFYNGPISMNPPKSLKTALAMILNFLRISTSELSGTQCIDFFNIFLAPYIKELSEKEVKDELQLFLTSINFTLPKGISLGLETVMPSFIAESKVFLPYGHTNEPYANYWDKSQLIASLIIECVKESVNSKPMFNPNLIIKIRPETFREEKSENLLFEAHEMAPEGIPYFANLCFKEETQSSHTPNGFRFAPNWMKDWELDTLRVGCIGRATLNLPWAIYNAKKEKNIYYDNILTLTEKALRALEIKYHTMRLRAHENLLPFLTQKREQDPYYRLENSTCLLSFVGLNEAAQYLNGEAIHESKESLKFAKETLEFISKIVKEYSKKQQIRFSLSVGPDTQAAKRLAKMDIKKYGLAEVHTQGNKDNPYYTNLTIIPYKTDMPLEKYLNIEEKFYPLTPGGHLTKIPLSSMEENIEKLFLITKKIVKDHKIGFYTFDRSLTYCKKCKRTFREIYVKCPKCSSFNAIIHFIRQPSKYQAKLHQ